MSKGSKGFLLAAATLGLAAVAVLEWPREPTYGGRRLSSWLNDFDGSQIETQARAAEAVRHIGPKAVPFVVKGLSSPYRRFRETWIVEWIQMWAFWLNDRTGIRILVPKHHDQRLEALAALDALRQDAADALPALQKLMEESPPDPRALYVIARTGPVGLPIVSGALTNKEHLLRCEAKVCSEMVQTHSPLLYGEIGLGRDAATFDRRTCLFNSRVIATAFREYRDQHPD